MTKFDNYVETREEARMQARYAEWNGWLLQSLKTRTKEEVEAQLCKDLLFALPVEKERTQKRGELLVF